MRLTLSGDAIGEAWVLSDHPQGRTRVANGPLAGETLGARAVFGLSAGTTPESFTALMVLEGEGRVDWEGGTAARRAALSSVGSP